MDAIITDIRIIYMAMAITGTATTTVAGMVAIPGMEDITTTGMDDIGKIACMAMTGRGDTAGIEMASAMGTDTAKAGTVKKINSTPASPGDTAGRVEGRAGSNMYSHVISAQKRAISSVQCATGGFL